MGCLFIELFSWDIVFAVSDFTLYGDAYGCFRYVSIWRDFSVKCEAVILGLPVSCLSPSVAELSDFCPVNVRFAF